MPQCSTCDADATLHWQRRATSEEWAQDVALWRQRAEDAGLPEDTFVPRDGLALKPVFGCDQHHPDDPTEVQPAPDSVGVS